MTETIDQVDTETVTRHAPIYNLIVLNDDFHTFEYVLEVLIKVFKFEVEKAASTVLHIHEKGEGIVFSGSLEVAELKHEQVTTFGADQYAAKAGMKVEFPLGTRIERV